MPTVVEGVQEVRPPVAPDAAHLQALGTSPAEHEVGEEVGIHTGPVAADLAAATVAAKANATVPAMGQTPPGGPVSVAVATTGAPGTP